MTENLRLCVLLVKCIHIFPVKLEAEKVEQEKGPEEKSEENKEGRKEEAMETDENKVRRFTLSFSCAKSVCAFLYIIDNTSF